MAFYDFTKKGQVFGTGEEVFFPWLVDYRSHGTFPLDWAIYASTDHSSGDGGIHLYVADGDPTIKSNWKTYDQAVSDGDFSSITSKPSGNPIFVDTTQGTQTETPAVQIISGDVYLTYHQVNPDGNSDQKTLLATSPDGVNFSRYTQHTSGDDAVILPVSVISEANHTGYFRWFENPFSGLSSTYVGYSLVIGGGKGVMGQWASDDAINWSFNGVLRRNKGRYGLPTDYVLQWNKIDLSTISDLGGGEYAVLISAGSPSSGAVARETVVCEVVLGSKGRNVKRMARTVIDRGGSGSIDEDQALYSSGIEYNGTEVRFYDAVDSNNENSLALATGSLAPSSVPPAVQSPTGYFDTEYFQDFRGASSFISSFEAVTNNGASYSFTSSGLELEANTSDKSVEPRLANSIVPDNYDLIEIYVTGLNISTRNVSLVAIGTPEVMGVDDGVQAVSFTSVGFVYEARSRVGGSNDLNEATNNYQIEGAQSVGIRWWPRQQKATLVMESGEDVYAWDVSTNVDTSLAMYPKYGRKAASATIETMRVRLRSRDTTAPTITGAEVSSAGDTVTINADEPIDFGQAGVDGFTLNASGGNPSLTFQGGYGTQSHTYALSRTIDQGESLSLDYTQPGDGWKDASENDLQTFSGTSVTNDSTQSTTARTLDASLQGAPGTLNADLSTGSTLTIDASLQGAPGTLSASITEADVKRLATLNAKLTD